MTVFTVTTLGYESLEPDTYEKDSSVFLPGGDNEPELGLEGTACFERVM